jgi:uncharacterized protein with PIN domain
LSEIRYYLDENVDKAVAEQLILSGIDAVSVHSLELRGESDEDHLKNATEQERVLCTHDQDFLRMANEIYDHAGIAYAPHYQASVGGWVRALRSLHAKMTAEEVQGMVVFLSLK